MNGNGGPQTAGQLPTPLFPRGSFTGRRIPFVSASGYAANLAELQSRAFATGHLMALPDADGLNRRVPMLYEYDGNYYESLSIAVARNVLGVNGVVPVYGDESRTGRGRSNPEWLRALVLNSPILLIYGLSPVSPRSRIAFGELACSNNLLVALLTLTSVAWAESMTATSS